MKKYLDCTVTMNSGDTFNNPLKLSEAYLVSQLAQENEKVVVHLQEVSKERYDQIF